MSENPPLTEGMELIGQRCRIHHSIENDPQKVRQAIEGELTRLRLIAANKNVKFALTYKGVTTYFGLEPIWTVDRILQSWEADREARER